MKVILWGLGFVLLLISCQSGVEKGNLNNKKWSIKMANSVMSRYDSLLKYDHGRIRWQYDVAYVGQSIDKLGHLDDKYSKYLETYVDYFVQEDG